MSQTKISSNILAANAAQDNLNAGASITLTKAVSLSGNLTVDTNTFFVDSVNNGVGVGTTTPAAKLHIDSGNATASQLRFTAGTTTGLLSTDGFEVGISTTGVGEIRQRENLALEMYTSNVLRLQFTGAGNMIIDGSSSLRGGSGTAAAPFYTFNGAGIDCGMYRSTGSTLGFSTTGTARMFIDASGLIGIGTTTPGSKLDVNGTLNVSGNTTLLGTTTATGKITANGQGALSALSANDVMTLSLAADYKKRYLFEQAPMPLAWTTTSGTANSTGANHGTSFSIILNGPTAVAGNYRETLAFGYSPLTRPGSGGNMPLLNARFTVLFDVYYNGLSNTEAHLIFGAVGTAGATLSAAGVAVVWLTNTTLKLQVHNGITLVESSPITVTDITSNHARYLISWDGSKIVLGQSKMPTAGGVYPNFTKLGELSGSSIPTYAGGAYWKALIIATGATSFGHTMTAYSTQYVPYVIDI